MTFKGEVIALRSTGDEAEITVSNLRGATAAPWREYGPPASFRIPLSKVRAFSVGTRVTLSIRRTR